MRYILLIFLLTGCYIAPSNEVTPTRPSVSLPSPTPRPTDAAGNAAPMPAGSFDALPAMQGICFEAAWDAAGQVFIMRNAEEHINFYDLVDNSRLCRRPVERLPFDFSTGDILAGLWNRGYGCTASHTVMAFVRDDATKTILIQLVFSTEGDCAYELVRGFWLGIHNAQDYEIVITYSQ